MNSQIKSWLYYIALVFFGYFIFRFQIEKSFNLLVVFALTISFSFFSFTTRINSRRLFPALFTITLFAMYGVRNENGYVKLDVVQFAEIALAFIIMLFLLLRKYDLRIKKLIVLLAAISLAFFYASKNELLNDYKILPFILGSFFMFRAISYLHEIKFAKKEAPLLDKINYFLLPSNFSMPLFPIVDYKIFISSYEGINEKTLERGTRLICRGLFQLLLYRFIYHEIIIPFDQIRNAYQVLVFLSANFLIVLRVIGAFHVAIGLIIIMGYNLPDIFNNIFFSTGFSNLWRRTNMYWRNFMMKIFYYPIYFRIKKIGVYTALILTTFICFFITWILHTYQWFWLKGTFPLELKDAIFWGSFGLLVSVNTYIQQNKIDKGIKAANGSFNFVRKAVAGLAVFLVMSVLWSIWTCNSLTAWWNVISRIRYIDPSQLRSIAALALGYLAVASIYHLSESAAQNNISFFRRQVFPSGIAGFAVLLVSIHLYSRYAIANERMTYRTKIVPMITEMLNRADRVMIDNGYYTNLISTNNYCSQAWINDYDISRNWTKYITMNTTRPSFDLKLTESIPLAGVKYKGISFTLNKDGLHDKDYPKQKPDSCFRIMVLGGSYECGNGLNDGEDFLSLIEDSLNNNYTVYRNDRRVNVEIINFSQNGYRLMQRLYYYKTFARQWKPDAILLFIHSRYHVRIVNYLNRLLYQGFPIDDVYLKNILEERHIAKGDNDMQIREKLGNYADSINYYAVRSISEMAHQDGSNVIAVFLPTVRAKGNQRDSVFVNNLCKMYGLGKISLNNVFEGYDGNSLSLSDLDFHPNKTANAIIAKSLLSKIIRHQDFLGIKINKN